MDWLDIWFADVSRSSADSCETGVDDLAGRVIAGAGREGATMAADVGEGDDGSLTAEGFG